MIDKIKHLKQVGATYISVGGHDCFLKKNGTELSIHVKDGKRKIKTVKISIDDLNRIVGLAGTIYE
jgi:hypothetical protein